MPLNIWNLEWLNHNSQRSYPIADWATKECTESSAIKLPDDFILALSIGVNACHSLDIDGFYIKSVLVMDTGCSVILGYQDEEVAVTHIVANSDQVTYALTGLGDFDDIVGYIAINPKSQILTGLSGYYNFEWEATCLEADCVRPMIKSISAFQVDDGSHVSSRMYGDIILKAGANMDITVASDGGVNTITLSAIDGSGLSEKCECEEDSERTPIRSINGITADPNGNINLVGTSCLRISTITNGLKLEDTCSEPCCGCPELDAIYDNLKDCMDGADTLKHAVEDLNAKQDQMELVYQSEGRNTCNCKLKDEPRPCKHYLYKYTLHSVVDTITNASGNETQVTLSNLHVFKFSEDTEEGTQPYELNDTILVKGLLSDENTRWSGTIEAISLYKTFDYMVKGENPDLFEEHPELFGTEWMTLNSLEELRCYFDVRPLRNITTWGPESIDRESEI